MPFALRNESGYQNRASWVFSLARGALHELYAAAQADGASLSALAMMLGETGGKQSRLWVRHAALARETGTPHPAGFSELGLDPASVLLLQARDASAALQAALEGARCTALGAVIVELWGETRVYDLAASRRLALAAKTSGVPVFLLRIGTKSIASAAETRWLARAAPSRALAAKAPGHPAFHLTLLRARNGQEGLQHHLEWNRDAQRFEDRLSSNGGPDYATPSDGGYPAPLPRPMVPVPFDRSGAAHDEPPSNERAG